MAITTLMFELQQTWPSIINWQQPLSATQQIGLVLAAQTRLHLIWKEMLLANTNRLWGPRSDACTATNLAQHHQLATSPFSYPATRSDAQNQVAQKLKGDIADWHWMANGLCYHHTPNVWLIVTQACSS